MNVFDLFATLSIDTSNYDKGLKDAEKEASGFGSKFKNTLVSTGKVMTGIFETVGKVAAATSTIAGGAVIKIGKQALDAYANFEQLVGGVETLFGNSADIVRKNADMAFKSSGLSANEYMETVTSFSASLLQSLGGDTEKAAAIADQAIIDMSDNANKMGSDISSIQNAYQGFAKQNYTMLDNLKLGYGGTKSEMERLIKDAEKLDSTFKATQDENGNLAMSYSDIIEAIHIVQTELGITGTTAKEASTTIQGSLASMKSAWQNLLVGTGNSSQPLDELVNNFVESVETVGDNVLPRVEVILNGIGQLVENIAPKIVEKLPEMAEKIIPGLLNAVKSLGNAIWKTIPSILDKTSKFLAKNSGNLVGGFIQLVTNVFKKANDIIKPVLQALPQMISDVAKALGDNVPELIGGVIDLINGLIENLPDILLAISNALPDILKGIFDGIVNNLPQLIEGVGKLIDGLVKNLPTMLETIVNTVGGLVTDLILAIFPFGEKFKKMFEGFNFGGFVGGVFGEVAKIAGGIFDFIGTLFDDPAEALKKAFDGVKSYAETVFTSIGDIVSGIWELLDDKINGERYRELQRKNAKKQIEEAEAMGWIFEENESGFYTKVGYRPGTEAERISLESMVTDSTPQQTETTVNHTGTITVEGKNDGEVVDSVTLIVEDLKRQMRM